MIFVLALIILLFAGLAVGFVMLPLLRRPRVAGEPRRAWRFASLAALGVFVCGLGTYGVLGQPQLALQTLTGPDEKDLSSLVASLAWRMPRRPDDIQGWTMLGRGYLRLGDSEQAAKALARAVALAHASEEKVPNDLLLSYGAALALDSKAEGAQKVFQEILTADPGNTDARYLLGLLYTENGNREGALAVWEKLEPDVPADAPWREGFQRQLAALRAAPGKAPGQAGASGGAPNVQAMVSRLAARLDADPDDINGWLMLVRAYAVLGEKDKAGAALAKARATFTGNKKALDAIDAQAKTSNLE